MSRSCRSLIAVLVLAPVVSACGSDDPEPAAEPPAPETPFTRAAEATRKAGNAMFQLEFSVRGPGDEASSEAAGEVDFEARTERSAGTLTNQGNSNSAEFYVENDTAFVRLADRGRWEVDPGGQQGALPSGAAEAIDFVEAVDGPAGTPGTAATGSGVARLYETTVSLAALDRVVEGGAADRFSAGGRLPIQVWITDDDRIVRVRVRQVEGGVRSVNDVDLLRIGEAEPPERPSGLPDA